MGSLAFMFKKIPNTSKIESEEAALIKEYNDFNAFSESDDLKHYLELEKEVNSPEFSDRKKEIKAQKFKDTEEYQKLKKYQELRKDKEIKNYYKVKDSPELESLREMEGSDTLKRYRELSEYVNSEAFREEKEYMNKKDYKESDAHKKEKEYQELKKMPGINKYFKFKQSRKYGIFKVVEGSEKLAEYEQLKDFVNSGKFSKTKEYMKLPPKKKYEQSEEYRMEQEYSELKNSEKIKWYFKLKKKNDFDILESRELTFEDDFSKGKLDRKKWITRYFWGEVLLKDNYSLPGDRHFYTDGKNMEFREGVLGIMTKQEKALGKVWTPILGFTEQEYDYTSGLISTARSLRQKYGLFKAKIKMNSVPLRQAFWMAGDRIMPHIDVAKMDGGKLRFGSYWGNIDEKKGVNKKLSRIGGSRFADEFFIYGIEWSPERIIWSINGVPVMKQTGDVPQEEMYVAISAGVTRSLSESQLPAGMEIDWVRVYRKTEPKT